VNVCVCVCVRAYNNFGRCLKVSEYRERPERERERDRERDIDVMRIKKIFFNGQ
jgi:hypothetical protein